MEEYPNTPSYTDALWLLGETFYASHEYLSARREYRELVQHGTEPRYVPYFGKALARLVDVCLRVGDIKGLDEVFAGLNQVPPAQVDAALLYAKGKAYFAKSDWNAAQSAFLAVPAGSTYTHQAKYFQGVVAIKLTPPGKPRHSMVRSAPSRRITRTRWTSSSRQRTCRRTPKIIAR